MSQQQIFDFNKFQPPKNFNKKTTILAISVILGLIFVLTSFFTVGAEEVGVVLRFGKYVRTVESGLRWKIPFGIETKTNVPVEKQLKQEFGFRTKVASRRSSFSVRAYMDEALMLTGDLNAAQVEWIVQYRISDPYKFLFMVRNAEQTFRDINEAVMRQIVGDRTVNEVLTIGRQDVEATVKQKLQEMADQYETGIKVEQLVLQDVNPPEPVKPAFNEVNEAQQEKEKLINQARSEYNKIIPKARGEAERTIEEAKGYATERINMAKGEADKFTSIFNEYVKAKEVTKKRIYLETMKEVLPKVGKKLITDEKVTGILPLFQLEKGGNK